MAVDLAGKVCLVTGASRGVGRGVALGLLEAGATVYITGRTKRDGEHPDGLDRAGSLASVLDESGKYPGRCVAHRVDHSSDIETEAIVRRVIADEGRLDVLVNSAWGGYERMEEDNRFTWVDPIWQQPMWRWDAMMDVGVRSSWCAIRIATEQMARQRSGLIVNISFWAAQKFMQNTVYGVSKAAMDKMAHDVAHQMREFDVAAVALYPGLVRTEEVLKNAQYFDMSNAESPEFQGSAVAHLAADPALMEKSGKVHTTAGLALEYGYADIDGYQPRPATLESV
ncbi:SDR family NAD(P)-dependent oxidoreductase [Devosia sp. ZB163]|uniref:SDR family NAD(P)-dependent oxidoreductase n=1 Tax=Devosia sp. ZB163 TaxID=3025938 RepID=UPI0023609D07|nr:SDR family NAD(P)-dependent oxidoreductase [Devosia sp. ZB163]MDC9825873.1 SDR family NAD(P)-dependent oxidoreductase [Devosia sp. ZB163]